MNPIRRLGAALKAATMVFAGNTRSWWTTTIGRTRIDYARDVGTGRGNAALMAVILWFCRTFPEAPIRISTVNAQGELTSEDNHPLKQLLDNPNPFYSGELLWHATLSDWQLGNAYWLKIRSGSGRPVQLWWIPDSLIEPKWPDDGSEFISHYEYRPDGKPKRLEVEDVVHFRNGLDPNNPRKGLSPVGALVRELFTDDEAASYTATMLRNVGVPPVVISPRPDKDGHTPKVDDAAAEEVKAKFEAVTSGDNRGRPLIMRGSTEITTLGFNPKDMDVKALRRIPEERISAIFGIPAVVVGLGAGLDRSTFANFAEAREAAYESNVIPSQRLLAAELRTQLLPDFGDPARLKIDFDLSKVRVLQDDQNELHARARENLLAGMWSLNRALKEIGDEPLTGPEGDMRFIPNTLTPMSDEDLALPPPPAPAAPLALPPGSQPAKVYSLPQKGRKAANLGEPLNLSQEELDAASIVTAADLEAAAALWAREAPDQLTELLDAQEATG